MAQVTITKVRFECDAHDAHTAEAETDGELPPQWVEYSGKYFASIDCLERWIRELGPLRLGLRTTGTGNASIATLDEVLSIRSRSWEDVVGCTSCGGKRGHHNMGCSVHR